MLGVFKRRWKPKSSAKANSSLNNKNNHLVPSYNLYSEPVLSIDGQFEKIISPSTRQIHSLCDEKTQLAATYETIKSPPQPHPPPSSLSGLGFSSVTAAPLLHPYAISNVPSPTLSEGGSKALSVTRAPNICVEDGRIEFVRDEAEGVQTRPNATIYNNNNNNDRRFESTRHSTDEKIDDAKECLEARIIELENALDMEKKLVQREKLTVARLQRHLSRKEVIQRDVDRERRLRSESDARLRRSEADTERCRAKLAVLQREFARMEDTVRSMLQYKTKYEQLKQDKASLTVACENHVQHFQNIITKIRDENGDLKKQLQSLSSSQEANSEVQSVLLERIEVLQNQNSKLMREGETQRKQYEKCLDDVTNQVVKALLTQKNLQDNVNRLHQRVKELESNNNSLSTLLLKRVQRNADTAAIRGAGGHTNLAGHCCQAFACLQSSLCNKLNVIAKKVQQRRPLSLDEKRLRRICDRTDSNNLIWVPLQRPQSLNLETTNPFLCIDKVTKEVEEESPESVIRDEGYSTMSSDVQCANEMPPKALEELKEVTDESDAPSYRVNSLDNTMLMSSRNSFPSAKHVLPCQHIIRSLSDSQLCLRITTSPLAATALAASKYYHNYSSSLQNHYHHYHHHYHHHHHHQNGVLPHARHRVSSLLEVTVKEEDAEDSFSFCSSDFIDAEYVQQWLQLDERRTTLPQHLRLEYNTSEVEDWSMEDNEHWKKVDRLEYRVPDASSKCSMVANLWDVAALRVDDERSKHLAWIEEDNRHSVSSDGSWSSSLATNSDEAGCANPMNAADSQSKRSSSVVSSSDASEGAPLVGATDFTRDFYRLVKFESSRSLASSSSRSQHEASSKTSSSSSSYSNSSDLVSTPDGCAGEGLSSATIGEVDREQALQSVFKFIAEQQRYCISRLEQDERNTREEGPAEMVSLTEEDDGYFSKISFGPEDTPGEDRSCCTDTGDSQTSSSIAAATTSAPADYKSFFRTCDSCFRTIEETADENICDSCAHSYIECLPEEASSPEYVESTVTETRLMRYTGGPSSATAIASKSCLDTVLEEQEEPMADDTTAFGGLHERASSRDVIDEIQRMIRKEGAELEDGHQDRSTPVTELDGSCGCSTGWVHVEQDIDFNDPKARANLLDVMLASSSSSSCGSSRNNSDSEYVDEERRNYKHLHRIHRFRRQRRASVSRQFIMGALRVTNCVRPSIIGRDNFFNRYGEKEREAVASFDFLEDLSTTSLSTASEPSDSASAASSSSVRVKHGASRGASSKRRMVNSTAYSRRLSADCDSCCDRYSCSE